MDSRAEPRRHPREAVLAPGERVDYVNENLRLIQKAKGMTFGTDALLLAAFVRPRPGRSALELGAGSGIVSLLCAARDKFAHVECVEVQPAYADLCRRNIRLNGMEERVSLTVCDLRDLSLFAPQAVETVIANPPYMKTASGASCADEGRNAARHEVCGTVADFCRGAAAKLRWGGSFFTVWRPDRLTDLVCALREHGLEPKEQIWVVPAPGADPAFVLTEAKRGSACGGLRTHVLTLCREDGSPSSALQEINETGMMPRGKYGL